MEIFCLFLSLSRSAHGNCYGTSTNYECGKEQNTVLVAVRNLSNSILTIPPSEQKSGVVDINNFHILRVSKQSISKLIITCSLLDLLHFIPIRISLMFSISLLFQFLVICSLIVEDLILFHSMKKLCFHLVSFLFLRKLLLLEIMLFTGAISPQSFSKRNQTSPLLDHLLLL
jgi:hypothetical protein